MVPSDGDIPVKATAPYEVLVCTMALTDVKAPITWQTKTKAIVRRFCR